MTNKISDNIGWEEDFEFVKNDIEFYDSDNNKMNPEDVYSDLRNVSGFICKSQRAIEYFEMWHYSSDFFAEFPHPIENHLYVYIFNTTGKHDFWMDFTSVYPQIRTIHRELVKNEAIGN